MSLVRAVAFAAGAFLLAGGYLSSQWAFLSGGAERYSQAIDTPEIKVLSLLLLVACVVSAALPQEVEAE